MSKKIEICKLGICANCHKHRMVFRYNRPLNGMMYRDHCYLCKECHPDKEVPKEHLAKLRGIEYVYQPMFSYR